MPSPATEIQASAASSIELTGIEVVGEAERTARPHQLFLPWFASNISVFGMSYGAWVLGFGISLPQALIVVVLGVVASFAICGVIALGGKRGSVLSTTMTLSAPRSARIWLMAPRLGQFRSGYHCGPRMAGPGDSPS